MTDAARFAVGVMSGTSIDGLDAALVRIDRHGLDMRASLIQHIAQPLGELAPRLRAIAEQKPVTTGEIATIAWTFGLAHVRIIERLFNQGSRQPTADGRPPHLICIHGQTVYHHPPISWQLINPAPIAARWPNAVVISDLRQHDLASGGQGAPITPLADWILFRDEKRSRAIVNLGGFCNVTVLSQGRGAESIADIRGFDVCPCNHWLDWVARERLGRPFDESGAAASRGQWHPPLRKSLQLSRYDPRYAKRSLGTGDEHIHILRTFVDLAPEDILASICEAIADNVAAAIDDVDQIILAGGGAYNETLVAAITRSTSCEVIRSDAIGVPIQAREAIAMAILGTLREDGIPITLPRITGRTP